MDRSRLDPALPTGSPAFLISDELSALSHGALALEAKTWRMTRADPALRVAVFGEFSVGKSTLINALLGKPILAAKLMPTTGVPTELRHGAELVTVIFRDGSKRQIPFAEVNSYSNLASAKRARDEVERIIVVTPAPFLQNGLALIDTPGVLDDERLTERARVAAAAADVVLLVLRADHLLSQCERSLALDWLTQDIGKPVTPVVNFMGQIDSQGREELGVILDRFCQSLISPFDRSWYAVDALPALRYRLGYGPVPAPDCDYLLFSATLAGLGARRIEELKTQSRARWHSSWIGRARRENAKMLEAVELETERLARARGEESERLEGLLLRLNAQRDGQRIRCGSEVDRYKSGHSRSLAYLLPPAEQLRTPEQQRQAAVVVDRALRGEVLWRIDRAANEILAEFLRDTGIIVAPLSIRELARLDFSPDVTGTSDGFAAKWVAEIHEAVETLVLFAAKVGTYFRFGGPYTPRRLVAVQSRLLASLDAELDRMKRLLRDQFDARAQEVISNLQQRTGTMRALPAPTREVALRRQLADRLDEASVSNEFS